jgi:hypothetical protein
MNKQKENNQRLNTLKVFEFFYLVKSKDKGVKEMEKGIRPDRKAGTQG